MKKIYISPICNCYEFEQESIIAASVKFGTEKGDAEDALTHKKRGMWGEENEEQKNEFWN